MDAAFMADDPNTRSQIFGSLMQSFGCVYVCLWSYFPRPSNYLISLDGYYNEAPEEPSTSSASLVRRLFDEYRQTVIPLEDGRVPGMAFAKNRPYVELRPPEILRLACNVAQRLFYHEAKIRTVVFMGCRSGEIELGMTYDAAQMKIEAGLREWFPEDFQRKSPIQSEYPLPPPPSSSSSSLRSLDSPNISEYSSLLFPVTVTVNPSTTLLTETVNPPLVPITTSMIQEGQQSLHAIRQREEEAMTRAILAVLSAPSSPPSTSSSPKKLKPRVSAFKRYFSGSGSGGGGSVNLRKQTSMTKRAIAFYGRLNVLRRERLVLGGPTATQLHHMISERKRREKLNESFQALRSLLPPGTKKDKASVLAGAREQLASLQSEVTRLSSRARELEAELTGESEIESLQPGERFSVRTRQVPESTSRERTVDLRVVLSGENVSVDDLVIRLLEFLKPITNVSLVSVEAQIRTEEGGDSSSVVASLRLKIEGEWDESAFQEAVKRVIADLAH
ncbi:PREDICTED: putative transcription factor bHLH041 [Tarenaya hassleriana]|uniref:putative transcription factor bHLH041 n=1 Tax=Tarenaya hassleriana TaxID=28532 RepID=UPI00053C109F|nr:PREDICTED: putative transcription factor bHLH041 [Tarenaya hassleriana]XP_019058562.1 PREDICTED: putative transcription factor bHLH041 [Tarenaya hassleriana]